MDLDGNSAAEAANEDQGTGAIHGGQMRVSADDQTFGYLNGKLVAGSNITLTENSGGAAETLTISSSGGGGGAPTDAQYWVGAPNGTLSAEKDLSALSTGLVKNTAGTPSTAVAGTDYVAPATTITAGAGLTGGGDLSTNRTIDVAAGDSSITVNANDIIVATDGVTYAKMQNISATQRLIGRNTAGAGDPEEVTASQALDWIGSTAGTTLYRGGSGWALATRLTYDDATDVVHAIGDLTSSKALNLHLKSGTDVDLKVLFEENGHALKPWYIGVDASDSHKLVIGHNSSTLGAGTVSIKFQSSSGDIEALTDWNFTKSGTQTFSKEGTGNLAFRAAATGQEITFKTKTTFEVLTLTDDNTIGICKILPGGTTYKLSFHNATPIAQQVLATGAGATVDNVITVLQNVGLCKQS